MDPPKSRLRHPSRRCERLRFLRPAPGDKKERLRSKTGGFLHFFSSKTGSLRVKHRTKRETTNDYATPLEDSRPRATASKCLAAAVNSCSAVVDQLTPTRVDDVLTWSLWSAKRAMRTRRIISSTCVPCPTTHVCFRTNASMQVNQKPTLPRQLPVLVYRKTLSRGTRTCRIICRTCVPESYFSSRVTTALQRRASCMTEPMTWQAAATLRARMGSCRSIFASRTTDCAAWKITSQMGASCSLNLALQHRRDPVILSAGMLPLVVV